MDDVSHRTKDLPKEVNAEADKWRVNKRDQYSTRRNTSVDWWEDNESKKDLDNEKLEN